MFLGPSLPVVEARAILNAAYLPPARQGDVFAALARRPRAIVLIDGVFEAQPSVWHHEILAALDAGVPVFGASSMGALRAAELHEYGMRGVGTIFEWYRDGVLTDDAEVALLHASADHDHRPLTLPLVNVRYAAQRAAKAGILRPAEARRLVTVAARRFYQSRSWPGLLRDLPWTEDRRERLARWLGRTDTDLKAKDARACLRKVAAAVRRPQSRAAVASRPHEGSLLVRTRRLQSHSAVLEALSGRPDAAEMTDAGLRRALLAGWARSRGMRVSKKALVQARTQFLEAHAPNADAQEQFLVDCGLDEGQLQNLLEEVLLERQVLEHATRMLPDGPSATEALAAESRLRGVWAAAQRKHRRR